MLELGLPREIKKKVLKQFANQNHTNCVNQTRMNKRHSCLVQQHQKHMDYVSQKSKENAYQKNQMSNTYLLCQVTKLSVKKSTLPRESNSQRHFC
eukprot:10770304-Ditylum_brightwellii.AAC.1